MNPSLSKQPLICIPAFRLHDRIPSPGPRVVDVGIRGHDVEIASQDYRPAGFIERFRVPDQTLEPRELVIELRPGLRIPVGKVDGRHGQAFDFRFEVASLAVSRIAAQTPSNFPGRFAFRQNGNTVVRPLPMPDRAVARALDRLHREFGVVRLQLLETDDIGTRLGQPLE